MGGNMHAHAWVTSQGGLASGWACPKVVGHVPSWLGRWLGMSQGGWVRAKVVYLVACWDIGYNG
nr:hypothetical protein Itr_chr15CG16030 [Ipomoea trifida]